MAFSYVDVDELEGEGPGGAVRKVRRELGARAFGFNYFTLPADAEGLEAAVTGPAGFTTDLSGAFAGIDGLLLLVAFAAVFVILVIVYRSPLLPLLLQSPPRLRACGLA